MIVLALKAKHQVWFCCGYWSSVSQTNTNIKKLTGIANKSKQTETLFLCRNILAMFFPKYHPIVIHSTEAPAFFRYSFWLSIPNTEQELIPKAKNFKAKKDSNSGEIKATQRQCDVLQPGTDPTPVWCAVCDNLGNQSTACVSHLIVPNPYRFIEAQSTTRDRFIIS